MNIDFQARELNEAIRRGNPAVYELFSEAGRAAFFPSAGIIAQTAEAKSKPIDATIGVALDDGGKPLSLPSIMKNSKLAPAESLSYSNSYGQARLRELWLKRIRTQNPSLKAMATTPVVTAGVTHGLDIISGLFMESGDSVIVPDMMWENCGLIFQHAELDTFPMFDGKGFNVAGFRKKLESRKGKQIILLNFPNNPTGYSLTKAEADGVAGAIKESAERGNKILAVCDDAYFGFFFEDSVFRESLFTKLAGLHENVLAVKLDGITKELYAWGLRIGFVTYACRGMTDETARALEHKSAGAVRASVSNCCTHSQFLAIKALESQGLAAEERKNFSLLKSRYDEVRKVLASGKFRGRFEALPFNSGYFMCARLKKGNANTVRRLLLQKYGTGVIALDSSHLRVAFSSVRKDNIRKLFENIHAACGE